MKTTNKRWLLIAWDDYYPRGGTDDWFGVFDDDDKESAQKRGEELIHSHKRDFYEIIDLWELL